MLILFAALFLTASTEASDSCAARRMDCYFDAYSVCAPERSKDEPCLRKVLASCDNLYKCGDSPAQAEAAKPLNAGYELRSKAHFAESCAPYRRMLEARIGKAVARLQDCVNYAFVRDDLAKRLKTVFDSSQYVRIRCDEPPRSNWCGAAGAGEIWLSPSKMLEPTGFCHRDVESFFIHEVAHLGALKMSSSHNELGETGELDEVYSLQNYCMRSARMWILRARRTQDVVEPSRLSCMRDYQELTPSTDRDPFWDEFRSRSDRGVDPCPASRDLSLEKKPVKGRRGD